MAKFDTADILKVMQSLVLPMELKMNSLIDMVRTLEAKIDLLVTTNSEQQEIPKAGTMTSGNEDANHRPQRKSERALPPNPGLQLNQREKKSEPIMTRRQRARLEIATDDVRATATATDDAATTSAETTARKEPNANAMLFPSSHSHRRPALARTHVTNAPSTSMTQTPNVTNDEERNEQWTTVRRRKRLPRPVIKGTGEADTGLTAIEKTRMIHLWSLRYDTTIENVQAYMLKKKRYDTNYTIQKLVLNHNQYASFVVTVPESLFSFFMAPENWPPNTRLNEWFRKPNNANRQNQ